MSASLESYQQPIIDALTEAEVRPSEAVIVGGAALQMFGIKRTVDIDLVVTPAYMEAIRVEMEERVLEVGARGLSVVFTDRGAGQTWTEEPEPGYGIDYYKGSLTYMLAPNDSLYRATQAELFSEAVVTRGFLVSPPERILAWKQGVGRKKDVRDIQLIQSYLAKPQQQQLS